MLLKPADDPATVLSNSDTMSAPPPYFDPQQNENLYSSIEEQAKEPATYPNEKQLLQAAEAEERERNEQPQASTSTSGTDLSIRAGGRPIKLHIYKKPGITQRDIEVYAEDKTTVLYYLAFENSVWSGKWNLALRRGGSDGDEILRVTKGNWTNTIALRAQDGRETLVKRPKVLKAAHDFSGLDGKTKYRWKGKVMSSDLSLYQLDDADEPKQGVAEWNKTNWAKYKTGSLDVNANFESDLDLIVGSILAIDEWNREVNTVIAVTA